MSVPTIVDAIVLAGGRAARLDGADKARLTVGGRPLVDRVAEAAASAGARRVVVAGPRPAPATGIAGLSGATPAVELRHVVDDPPFGGPLAGLAAALDETDAPVVLVLACDLPFADASVPALLAALDDAPGADGAVLHDADDRAQWLFAAYRRSALDAGLRALGDVRDRPVRALVEPLDLVAVPAAGDAALDVDRWGDLARASGIAAASAIAAASSSEATEASGAKSTATSVPTRSPGGHAMSEASDTQVPPVVLDDWVAALSAKLGLDPADVPVGALLDLTRDVAHGVTRPAGPLTTFLVGVAAGRGADLDGAVRHARELAADWDAR